MSVKALGFPDSASISATTMAVVAVGYVLTAVAPHVRAFRDLQRGWNAAKTASVDALKKLQRLPGAITTVQDAFAELEGMGPNTAVLKLKKVRTDVTRCLDDMDLALLAVDTVRQKVSGLRKFRAHMVRVRPDFDKVVDDFEEKMAGLDSLREAVETVRDSHLIEQFDEAIELAVDAATAYAIAKSLDLAKARPRATVADALASLEKIHAFARAQGVKFGA